MKRHIRKYTRRFLRVVRKIPPSVHFLGCVAGLSYTVYLVQTGKTDPTTGTITFVASMAILFWNITVFSKYRLGLRKVFLTYLIIGVLAGSTILAFNGVSPFAEWKCQTENWIEDRLSETEVSARVVATEDGVTGSPEEGYSVWVEVTPHKAVEPDKVYQVDLLDSEDEFLGSQSVSWTSDNRCNVVPLVFQTEANPLHRTNVAISRAVEECEPQGAWDTWKATTFDKLIKDILRVRVVE